jgi:hypothetical protein
VISLAHLLTRDAQQDLNCPVYTSCSFCTNAAITGTTCYWCNNVDGNVGDGTCISDPTSFCNVNTAPYNSLKVRACGAHLVVVTMCGDAPGDAV